MRLQDVQLPAPLRKKGQRNVRRKWTPGADRRPFSSGVEEFQVAASGGLWVAAGANGARRVESSAAQPHFSTCRISSWTLPVVTYR
jgi:hypothetical protein